MLIINDKSIIRNVTDMIIANNLTYTNLSKFFSVINQNQNDDTNNINLGINKLYTIFLYYLQNTEILINKIKEISLESLDLGILSGSVPKKNIIDSLILEKSDSVFVYENTIYTKPNLQKSYNFEYNTVFIQNTNGKSLTSIDNIKDFNNYYKIKTNSVNEKLFLDIAIEFQNPKPINGCILFFEDILNLPTSLSYDVYDNNGIKVDGVFINNKKEINVEDIYDYKDNLAYLFFKDSYLCSKIVFKMNKTEKVNNEYSISLKQIQFYLFSFPEESFAYFRYSNKNPIKKVALKSLTNRNIDEVIYSYSFDDVSYNIFNPFNLEDGEIIDINTMSINSISTLREIRELYFKILFKPKSKSLDINYGDSWFFETIEDGATINDTNNIFYSGYDYSYGSLNEITSNNILNENILLNSEYIIRDEKIIPNTSDLELNDEIKILEDRVYILSDEIYSYVEPTGSSIPDKISIVKYSLPFVSNASDVVYSKNYFANQKLWNVITFDNFKEDTYTIVYNKEIFYLDYSLGFLKSSLAQVFQIKEYVNGSEEYSIFSSIGIKIGSGKIEKITKNIEIISETGETVLAERDFYYIFLCKDFPYKSTTISDYNFNYKYPALENTSKDWYNKDGEIIFNSKVSQKINILGLYVKFSVVNNFRPKIINNKLKYILELIYPNKSKEVIDQYDNFSAKLNKRCIIPGSILLTKNNSNTNIITKEIEYIDGNIEFYSTRIVTEVISSVVNNQISLSYTIFDINTIIERISDPDRLFIERVYSLDELNSIGQYYIDMNTNILFLPKDYKATDRPIIISYKTEDINNTALYSIDYVNGILYSNKQIESGLTIEYNYTNYIASYDSYKLLEKDIDYSIDNRNKFSKIKNYEEVNLIYPRSNIQTYNVNEIGYIDYIDMTLIDIDYL